MRNALMLAACLAAAMAAITPKADNPYTKYTKIYVNPTYATKVVKAEAAHTDVKCKMETIRKTPSFIWLDRIAMVTKLPDYMEDAKAEGSAVQIVVYDLPNRDCAALSSNGELLVANDGLATYKRDYIDAIKAVLDKYPTVPVIMVIEPDSLPNLVTNMDQAKCKEGADSYKQGIAYAISKLAGPNHYMYIDAAHECWLGWDNNMNGFPDVIKAVFALATDTSSVRGFATNVANYQNLHLFQGNTGCGDSNPVPDHARYIDVLTAKMVSSGVFTSTPQVIIDTARNGAKDQRSKVGNWCNIKGAGIGAFHKAGGDGTISNIDAYVWVKPPGESDGTSDSPATRYDAHCGSIDSLMPAPEAGDWFDAHFMQLLNAAVPAVVADATCASGSVGKCTLSAAPTGATSIGTCASVAPTAMCELVCSSGLTSTPGACGADGTWATDPICSKATPSATKCALLTPPAGASTVGTCGSVEAGKQCNVECKSGFTATAGVCGPTGLWQTQPKCTGSTPASPCTLSSKPAGASGFGNCASVAAGDSCALTCQSGYTAVSGQCGSDGTWSTQPSCTSGSATSCTLTTKPSGASSLGDCASVSAGGSCNVVCQSGFTRVAGQCGSDGSWTVEPACKSSAPSTCAYEAPAHASGQGTCASKQASGTTCDVKCESGYSVVTGVCADGTWTTQPACAKADGATCELDMSEINGAGTCKADQPSGTTCAPVCAGSATPITGTCSDGQWVPKPSCDDPSKGAAGAAAAGLAILALARLL